MAPWECRRGDARAGTGLRAACEVREGAKCRPKTPATLVTASGLPWPTRRSRSVASSRRSGRGRSGCLPTSPTSGGGSDGSTTPPPRRSAGCTTPVLPDWTISNARSPPSL
jgi:hypothetical protein